MTDFKVVGDLCLILKWNAVSLVKDLRHIWKHIRWMTRDGEDQLYCALCHVRFVSDMPAEMKQSLGVD